MSVFVFFDALFLGGFRAEKPSFFNGFRHTKKYFPTTAIIHKKMRIFAKL